MTGRKLRAMQYGDRQAASDRNLCRYICARRFQNCACFIGRGIAMDAQPDTLPRDPINELYDAALDLRRAFPPSHYDDGRPRSAALLPHLRRAAYLRGRLQRAELAGYLSDAVLASSMTIAFVVDRD